MQQVWLNGLEWDKRLPQEFFTKVNTWFAELSILSEIKILRCLQLKKEVKCAKLHIFVDASQEAYGTAVYIKIEYKDGSSSVHLVASKTKVAPLHSISIPRLELMGAILGSRLAKSVANALSVETKSIAFWTDSANVLWWIRGYSRAFKPFVTNRVGEIQMSSSPEQWRYIPTAMNPADSLTRGVKLVEIMNLKLWWEGPEYLKEDKSLWPKNIVEKEPSNSVKIKNSDLSRTMLSRSIDTSIWRLNPERFSSGTRLTRTQAWVMRFMSNCHISKNERLNNELTSEEIIDAESHIVKLMQQKIFYEEYSALIRKNKLPKHSKLLKLCPRLDDDGIIRADG